MANDILQNEEIQEQPIFQNPLTGQSNYPQSSPSQYSPYVVSKYFITQPNGDLTIGDYAGGQGIFWDQSAGILDIRGGVSVDFIDIPDTTTANSFHVDSDGNTWWGATTFAGAVASVSKAGAGVFSNITITGGSISGSTTVGIGNVNIAARGWNQTCAFSVLDADTVQWGAGTFVSADGTSYSIGAGNTGNMSARTYIYLDIAVSTTAYQVTTTASTAVGAGKVLIATAINGSVEPTFTVFGGVGGQNIDATSIVANSITANELSTSITYAGSIIIDSAGLIRSGQTDYATGTGWWIGNAGGTPKFSIGNSTRYLRWDGSALMIAGVFNGNVIKDMTAGETLTTRDALIMGATLSDQTYQISQTTTDNTNRYDSTANQTEWGQTFTTRKYDRQRLISVVFKMDRIGTPGDITVGIYATSGGTPTGSALATKTFTVSSTGSTTEQTITFDTPVALSSNTLYAIVITPGTITTANYYRFDVNSSSVYSGGTALEKQSGIWEADTQGDLEFYFKANLDEDPITAGKVYKAEADSPYAAFYNNFVGFADSSVANGATVGLICAGIVGGFVGLTPGSVYYLSDTAGAISTSAGTNSVKIGRAVSTTEILIVIPPL